MGTKRDDHKPLPQSEEAAAKSLANGNPTEPDRGQWSGKFDFLMSMIAYAVGLGNVWRFPYLCYKNGGGTFLVAYAFFFVLAAVPIFAMEVTIGQYLQRGAMEMWNMAPIYKGVGIGNVVISFMCIAYFCIIVAWATHYMINSFSSTFPWETCTNAWNNLNNITNCLTGKESGIEKTRIEAIASAANVSVQTSVEQYWENRVLQQTNDIAEFGGIQWELLGLSLLAWLVVYFALWKGITEARKFVYFCALFPYFLIAILLIRGITLPGASTGIYYYLTPNMTKLMETTVWKDAGTQVFYSYGVGFGTLIALGSHNKFNHNCVRDAVLMCFINGSTSIIAGFAIFSVLGDMSARTGKAMNDIVKPGVGLAFLAYPEVATNLPFMKQFFAFLFFLMITILGIDSQVCMVEGLFTAVEDTFPIMRRYKKISLGLTCLFFFLLGIPMITKAGVHWLTLVDAYGASGYALLFVVFWEVVGIAYGFGAERVRVAVKEMTGKSIPKFISYIWKFISPATAFLLFIFCIVYYEPTQYANKKPMPVWANVFGWFLSSCSMIVIPGWALYYLFSKNKHLSLMERLRKGSGMNLEEIRTTHRPQANGEEMKFLDNKS